jgi:hypothetical protein
MSGIFDKPISLEFGLLTQVLFQKIPSVRTYVGQATLGSPNNSRGTVTEEIPIQGREVGWFMDAFRFHINGNFWNNDWVAFGVGGDASVSLSNGTDTNNSAVRVGWAVGLRSTFILSPHFNLAGEISYVGAHLSGIERSISETSHGASLGVKAIVPLDPKDPGLAIIIGCDFDNFFDLKGQYDFVIRAGLHLSVNL